MEHSPNKLQRCLWRSPWLRPEVLIMCVIMKSSFQFSCKNLHLKYFQCWTISSSIQLTSTIFSIVNFVQKKLLNFYLVFGVFENKICGSVKNPSWLYQESIMALWGIRHGSTRKWSWLYEESGMALGGVRHGSLRNLSWLWEECVTCGD